MAFYRLPGDETIKVVAQKTGGLQKYAAGEDYIYEQGFLLSPFKEGEGWQTAIIRPDVFTTADKLPALEFAVDAINLHDESAPQKLKTTRKNSFKKYVRGIRKQIRKGKFKKIVAARVSKHPKPVAFEEAAFFESLCKQYPSAFVSLNFTPQFGLWIGATPEILLEVNSSGFKTYSLAGTKANTNWNANTGWGEKEKEEQAIVTRYITNAFATVTKTEGKILGPETIEAGNLLHLRTTFVYDSIPHFNWQKVATQLHPTPAVGGLPKEESIRYISGHEPFDRGFYSGYLGPVNLDEQVNLFVNLRCMKVLRNKLALFVGCGITADSKPAKEWKESKIKTQTLLRVLSKREGVLAVSKNVASLPPDANSEKGSATDSGDLQAQGNT